VVQIASDSLTKIASENWSPAALARSAPPAFQADVVSDIYAKELGGGSEKPPKLRRIMLLEISQYLENYLWPHFDVVAATYQHVMSIILMVNEKFRENVPAWDCFMAHQVRDGGPSQPL
jgi:intron-binding protein aquarius